MNVDHVAGRLQRHAVRRHNDVVRLTDSFPTVTSVDGQFLVDGSGEAAQTVHFPVRFIERPNFVSGGELHLDTSPVAGQAPTISCVINTWITDPPVLTTAQLYFIGANLVVVSTGPSNQRMWVHWRATGRALVAPNT